MKSRLLAALVLGGLVASASAEARQGVLFTGPAAAPSSGDPLVRDLRAQPATRALALTRLDASVVAAGTRSLRLDLGGLALVATRQTSARSAATGNLVWTGTVPGGSVVLVSSDAGVVGTVRTGGRLFRIQPVAGGLHAVVEVDERRMPPDHPAAAWRQVVDAARAAAPARVAPRAPGDGCRLRDPACRPTGTSPGNTTQTIRVAVAASAEASALHGGALAAVADLAIAESNQGFAASGIGIRFELAGFEPTTYAESGDFSTDLGRFADTSDGFLDGFHATRDALAADVSVLLVNNTQYCGIGYLNSGAETAFSVVAVNCATGYYSFAHEIGHNLGASHDPATSTNPIYPYGHGYRAPDNSWRTIMAYACPGGCPRLNHWSSAAVRHEGRPMGNFGPSNNARVLEERKGTVAGFR